MFPTSVHLPPTLTRVLLEFCNGGRVQKTRMMPYQTVKKCDDMSISIRLDIVPTLDGQT